MLIIKGDYRLCHSFSMNSPRQVDEGFRLFCFGLTFFHNLVTDFSDCFLWQDFSAVAGVVAASRFVLLNKTNRASGSKFAEQGFETDRANS